MYYNNNEKEFKEILYSAQKNTKNKFDYNNLTSEINKKYLPFQRGKPSTKYKAKSLLNSNNIDNAELNFNNINSEYILNENNNASFNLKSKDISKVIPFNSDLNSLYFQMNNTNKEKYKNFYNSTGKQEKKYVRNLSEEQQMNTNGPNQRDTLRKKSSFINKMLNKKKNNNFFHEVPDLKNKVQYYSNLNKSKNNKYKEFLSKSSFNNSIHNIEETNDINNYINNGYMALNKIHESPTNSNIKNKKFSEKKSVKNQNNLKYNLHNKEKFRINNYIVNNANQNRKIDNLKVNKNYENRTLSKKKDVIKNFNQINNNIIKNNNIIFKMNSYTPLNNNENFIFTNPNNENQNYIIRDSLINENNNHTNFTLSLNKENKLNDKSCPKYVQRNSNNNNYTNIDNINNNNNYIVNVNKYINIINKKNKIIRKNSNAINIHKLKSYKMIDNSNSVKKNNKGKYIKKVSNIKNNNYLNSPNDIYSKKFKSINKINNIPNTNYKDNYINKFYNYTKNNDKIIYTTNTQEDNNNKMHQNIEFKKIKTLNYANRNDLKNINIFENKIIHLNPRKIIDFDLKKNILDSNSIKYIINKSNTNSSLMNGVNNNNLYYKKDKFISNKIYSDSFSSNIKNLNSSQRNSHNNYNTNINNIDKNSNYKKGRNEKYNLENIFKPQTIGQKRDIFISQINSNRNPKIKNKDSKTISIIEKDKDKDKFENKIKKNENINSNNNNINLIKLMKTVNEYKNKTKNSKPKYKNYINSNKNLLKNNKEKENNYITNIINNLNENNNILNKPKLKNSYNPGYKEISNLKAINDNKILENITQNTLTMYSIYIISYYFTDFKKIGLSKIILLNKENKPIPVICSNNNCGNDSNKLFDITNINKMKNYHKPFITDFKKNIYINFYVNNIQSNSIKYIQIINFIDIKNKISPVGNIEIFQEKKLIFKGILNSNKISTIVLKNNENGINDINNNIKEIEDLSDINEINITNNRPYSLSKYKSMEGEPNSNEKQNLIINNEYDNFYTARGALFKGFSNIIDDYNKSNDIDNFIQNNFDSKFPLNNENEIDEDNSNSFKNNDFELDSLLSQKISMEFNKTNNSNSNNHNNTYKSNNIANEKYQIFNTNNNSINKLTYSNSNNNINKNNVTLNNNNTNHAFLNLLKKAYNKKEKEDFEQIFRTSICKMRDYSSFNLKDSINNNNTATKRNINKELFNKYEDSFSNINIYNDNIDIIDNNNMYNNLKQSHFIEFNKIRFIISSNYGHHKYVGLTGLELFNVKGEPINIETALTIGALPKDLRTIYNDEKENRIFENVFNKINNTNDIDNMWVTILKKNNPLPFIELYFKEKIRISKIKIYNYNEKGKLDIGAKTIELYLDDEYYNTIYLRQGSGEIAIDYIKVKNKLINYEENEIPLELDDNSEDFGQEITFPILDITQNELTPLKNTFYSSLKSNFNYSNNEDNNSNNNNTINKRQMKLASFLYKQSYETPYLPCGYYIKLVLSSNYYKGIVRYEENELKYSDIGLNKIEIYDENGKNIINNGLQEKNNDNYINYKIISNCEILKDENEEENNFKNKIIINGGDIGENENGNNCIFYVFDKPIRISYIKFYPLKEENKPILNSAKEIKIFSDCNIIFEGNLYLNKPTIVLFTCETKIIKNLNENYLTKEINERTYKEEKNEKYISLMMN